MPTVPSLFSIINEPHEAALRDQKINADIDRERTDTAVEQRSLQNSIAFQDAMAKIVGPGSDIGDIANGTDPVSRKKQAAIAAAYAQFAPDRLPGYINALEMGNYRRSEAAAKDQQQMGARFAAVHDPASYEALRPDIMAAGGYAKFGLTGDWEQDKERVTLIGRAGMTSAQQATDAYHQEESKRKQEEAAARLSEKQAELAERQKEARERAAEKATMIAQAAKREERLREMGQEREDKTLANIKNKTATVQGKDMDKAKEIIEIDDRTKGLPAALKGPIASAIAQRARNIMADSINTYADIGKVPDYADAVTTAIDQLETEGKLKAHQPYTVFGVKVPGMEESPTYKPENVKAKTYVPLNRKPAEPTKAADLTPEQKNVFKFLRENPKNASYSDEEIIREARKAGIM